MSGKARELIIGNRIEIMGHYDLPQPERRLPDDRSTSAYDPPNHPFIEKMWLTFIAQCFADASKIRLIAHHGQDIASLLPYLNSTLRAAEYSSEIPVLTYKKGIRMISLYRDKIGVAKADDLLDAWLCMKEIREKIQWAHDHKDEITPDFEMRAAPSALDIYKLLPRTNCGKCGKPTCMAFAAAVANGEAEADNCPTLMKAESAEGRNELLELLGEAS
jgi:ArsR family metal-binding transcriptional regulator